MMMMIGIIITDKGSPAVSMCPGWGSAGETLILTYSRATQCVFCRRLGLPWAEEEEEERAVEGFRLHTLCCREMMWKRTQQQWVEEGKVGQGKK